MKAAERPGNRRKKPENGPPSVTVARRAAASVLWAVSRGRRLDRALGEAAADLPPRERRWVQEAAYGTVRLRGRLDYLLDLHLKKGIESISTRFLDLLRLGCYQILYMESVPTYAAISQTVDQVKQEMGGGSGGLANGVLRSLSREGGREERFPPLRQRPLDHLSTWGSHPRWLVERWLRRWGSEETEALVLANNQTPRLFFRPLGRKPDEVAGPMAAQGWISEGLGKGIPCLRLGDGTNPARLLSEFRGIIQDPGAALVTVYADPPRGVPVMDLCAAPGGKTMALAGNDVRVYAGDRSLSRIRMVGENLSRVGGVVEVFVADARHPPLRQASFMFLDVPCSGTGTLRRHPDARWRLTAEMLVELVELQAEILDACGALIPPGGHLLYSTCTLEEEENENQVASFLSRHPAFEIQETGTIPAEFLGEDLCLKVLPQSSGFDGAYAARMVRRS